MRRLTHRKYSQRQGTKDSHRADTVVATVWLVFYVVALGFAITSPFVSHAIETAGR